MSLPLPEFELRDPVADTGLSIALGKRLAIRLTEIPTSGFRWQYALTQPGVVELVGDDYVSSGDLPGSPGYRSFVFRGSRRGATGIRFRLRRAWETAPPLKELVVSVEVADS